MTTAILIGPPGAGKSTVGPLLAALLGVAVLDTGTQRLLAGQRVVYLQTGFAVAARRTGLDAPRPLLLGNPRARMKALLEERVPVYEGLAWVTAVTDDRDPQEIAEEIAATIAGRIAAEVGEGAGASWGDGDTDDDGEPAGPSR